MVMGFPPDLAQHSWQGCVEIDAQRHGLMVALAKLTAREQHTGFHVPLLCSVIATVWL